MSFDMLFSVTLLLHITMATVFFVTPDDSDFINNNNTKSARSLYRICDRVCENRSYLHKIHLFILSYLSLLLCGLYNILLNSLVYMMKFLINYGTMLGKRVIKFERLKFYVQIRLIFTNSVTYYLKSRLMIVSREAKKKQAVRDEQVSYLHVAPL